MSKVYTRIENSLQIYARVFANLLLIRLVNYLIRTSIEAIYICRLCYLCIYYFR